MKKLIPFDWDKYQKGAKAVFKDSPLEIIIIINSGMDEECPLHIICKDGCESFSSYATLKGNCDDEILLLEVEQEEKTFYVNVFSDGVEYLTYNNKENAIINQKRENFIGLLKVTYTDEDLIK